MPTEVVAILFVVGTILSSILLSFAVKYLARDVRKLERRVNRLEQHQEWQAQRTKESYPREAE